MKSFYKSVILSISFLIFGALIGGFSMFYYTGTIGKDLISDWSFNTASYNVSNNIRLLYHLRKSEYDYTTTAIEEELDSSIILLGSLLNEESMLTQFQKEKIFNQIKAFKSYRDKFPKEYQFKEVENIITEIVKYIE